MCVVGIFGKDNLGYKSKAVHLNGTIGKEVFKVCSNRDCMFKNKSREVCVVFSLWNIRDFQHPKRKKIPTFVQILVLYRTMNYCVAIILNFVYLERLSTDQS